MVSTSDLLAGTRWRIASIDGVPVLASEVLPVDFGHDGRASGSTGVNQFTASYNVTSEYLTFGPMATTRRAGPPELLEQEGRVVQSLAGMCRYHLDSVGLAIDGPLGRVELMSTIPSTPAPASASAGAPDEPS